jgi:O-antigen ligase
MRRRWRSRIAGRCGLRAGMTDASIHPRWLWTSVLLGTYATLIALVPDTASRLALVAPALLIAISWWTLAGGPDRWLLTFLCAAVLLPPLPIPLGDSGPHPCLVIAALGVFAGLIRLSDWSIPASGLSRSIFVLFFLLLASVALAAMYSGMPVALGSLARVLLFGISVYIFFYVTCGPAAQYPSGSFRSLRLLFFAGALSALFACVDFYFQFPAPAGFGPQYVWLDSGVYRRAQGLFYEASTLGNFCAFFLVTIAVALMRPKKNFPISRPVLLAGAALFSAALVLSFSRASLLNVLVSIAALLWLNRRRFRSRRIALMFLFAAVAGSAVTYYLLPTFTQLYWDRLSASATYMFSSTEGVLSGRLSSWSALAAFLRDHPAYALLGIGYKTLPYSNFIGQPVVGDNMYLTMLVETGVIGLAALLLLNVAILKAAYRATRLSDPAASFFGTCMFCFWTGQIFQMMSGDLLTYWRVLPFYFWTLAVAVRAANEHSLPRSIQ